MSNRAVLAVLAILATALAVAPSALAAEPALSWSSPQTVGSAAIVDVDCPTSGLCVAVDSDGNVITSTDAAGPAASWSAADVIGSSLHSVSCASPTLCVAVSTAGNLVTSTDPTGGVGAWTESFSGFRSYMRAISCPTTSFCLVVDKEGAAWSSTNPTGGEGAWSQRFVDSEENLTDVSCPSTSFCVALDESGQVLTSTDPTGGMNAWGIANVPSGIASLSCPTTSLCLAAGEQQVVRGIPRVPADQNTSPRQPQSPSGSAPPPSRPSIHRQQGPLDVRGRTVTMVLECPGPSSCYGRVWLEAAFKPKPTSAHPKYRPIGSTRLDVAGQEVVTVTLNKAGRELLRTRKRPRARVRISAMPSTGVPLQLTQFAALKKRG